MLKSKCCSPLIRNKIYQLPQIFWFLFERFFAIIVTGSLLKTETTLLPQHLPNDISILFLQYLSFWVWTLLHVNWTLYKWIIHYTWAVEVGVRNEPYGGCPESVREKTEWRTHPMHWLRYANFVRGKKKVTFYVKQTQLIKPAEFQEKEIAISVCLK